jgi:hypothetical protein
MILTFGVCIFGTELRVTSWQKGSFIVPLPRMGVREGVQEPAFCIFPGLEVRI